MSNKGKNQLSEEELKERELKKFASNVSLLIKSVNNITNYLIDKNDDEISPKELRTVYESLRPTIKNIVAANKSKQNSKGGRSGKAKRDPDMPKKPPSPYFLFCGKMRPIVSKKDSTLHPQQVVTELGKLWKELPEDQKEKYKIEAEKQKAIYDEKMKEYLANKGAKEAKEEYDYSSSSTEEDEVESEGSDDDEKKKKKAAKAKTNNKKRKSPGTDGSSKKMKSEDEKKKKVKSNPKKAAAKPIKKKGKTNKKEEESSDSSTDISSDSD